MTYTIKRFSWTEETKSIVTHEETINGKTSGDVVISRGKLRSGNKPKGKIIKIKYHD